jgi:hypothetical protein
MRTRVAKSIACFALALSIAACGSDTTSPGAPTPLDLGPILGEMSAGGVLLIGGAPATTPWLPTDCTYSPTTRGFVCPTISAMGIIVARSYFLYDASGALQAQADAKTTAAIKTVTDMNGALPIPTPSPASATFTRHEEMTLSGLLTGKHTLNGTETTHTDLTVTEGSTTTHIVLQETGRTTNLLLPPLDGSVKWPQGGSITLDQTVVSTIGTAPAVTTTMREVLTYNGTSTVTLTITRGGVTTTCTFDLASSTAGGSSCGL